jgi:hypothetical protein
MFGGIVAASAILGRNLVGKVTKPITVLVGVNAAWRASPLERRSEPDWVNIRSSSADR